MPSRANIGFRRLLTLLLAVLLPALAAAAAPGPEGGVRLRTVVIDAGHGGHDPGAISNLYILGLQLSSVQWGTAIAAEAGAPASAGSRTLRDADDIAAAILSRGNSFPREQDSGETARRGTAAVRAGA